MRRLDAAFKEYVVLALILTVFLTLLAHSMLHARREARDDIRREEIAGYKREIDRHFEQYGVYPVEFDAYPHIYEVTLDDNGEVVTWYLWADLENFSQDQSGFDERPDRQYRFEIMNRDGGNTTQYMVCGGC